MAEVNNGGHCQFYSNSIGIVWEDAMEGFELIGLLKGKAIVDETVRRFGTRPSFDREERGNALDLIDDDFADLDSDFYNLDARVDIPNESRTISSTIGWHFISKAMLKCLRTDLFHFTRLAATTFPMFQNL